MKRITVLGGPWDGRVLDVQDYVEGIVVNPDQDATRTYVLRDGFAIPEDWDHAYTCVPDDPEHRKDVAVRAIGDLLAAPSVDVDVRSLRVRLDVHPIFGHAVIVDGRGPQREVPEK